MYSVELQDLKVKNVNFDTDLINCKFWNIRYPQKQKNFNNDILPILIGGEVRSFIAANETGSFFMWKDQKALDDNCGAIFHGHAS